MLGSLTPGKQGFGTTTWLTKNLRLPTIDRTNWTAIGQEELPQAGGQYTQYSIRTAVKRSHTGMGTVGQEMTSIVTAIFYVLSTLTSTFETAMTTAGLTILDAQLGSNNEFVLLVADNNLSVGDTIQVNPQGAIGAVSYVSSVPATATINAATGLVTAVAVNTGTPTVITATDATGKTGQVSITVFA